MYGVPVHMVRTVLPVCARAWVGLMRNKCATRATNCRPQSSSPSRSSQKKISTSKPRALRSFLKQTFPWLEPAGWYVPAMTSEIVLFEHVLTNKEGTPRKRSKAKQSQKRLMLHLKYHCCAGGGTAAQLTRSPRSRRERATVTTSNAVE